MKIHILREKIKTVSKKALSGVGVLALSAPMAFAGGLQVVQSDTNTVMALLKSLAMPVTVIAIMVVGFLMLFADRKHPALFRVAVAAFVIGGASQIAIWLLGGAGSF